MAALILATTPATSVFRRASACVSSLAICALMSEAEQRSAQIDFAFLAPSAQVLSYGHATRRSREGVPMAAAWFVDGAYLYKAWTGLGRQDALDYVKLR